MNIINGIEEKDEFTLLFWNKYYKNINTAHFQSLNNTLFD